MEMSESSEAVASRGCSNSISGGGVSSLSCGCCSGPSTFSSGMSPDEWRTRLRSLDPRVLFSLVRVSIKVFFASMVSSKASAIFCKLCTPAWPNHFSFRMTFNSLSMSDRWTLEAEAVADVLQNLRPLVASAALSSSDERFLSRSHCCQSSLDSEISLSRSIWNTWL